MRTTSNIIRERLEQLSKIRKLIEDNAGVHGFNFDLRIAGDKTATHIDNIMINGHIKPNAMAFLEVLETNVKGDLNWWIDAAKREKAELGLAIQAALSD
jgi:hypothetical protein